jgi:hypothetical protein
MLLLLLINFFCFQVNARLLYSNVAAVDGVVRTAVAKLSDSVQIQHLLKQDGIEAAEQRLYDIANPTSNNYWNWLTLLEVTNIVRLTGIHVTAITNWLTVNNITSQGYSAF